MSEWISCAKRLPLQMRQDSEFVTVEILVSDGATVTVTDYNVGQLPKPWGQFDSGCGIEHEDITHWQPLPSPPVTP